MKPEDIARAAKFHWMKDVPMNYGDMLIVNYEGAKYVSYALSYSADDINLDEVNGVLVVYAKDRQDLHEIVTRRTRKDGSGRREDRRIDDPPYRLDTNSKGS